MSQEITEMPGLEEAAEVNTGPRNARVWLPSLGLRVSERKLLLGALDIFFLCLSLVLALRLRTELIPSFPEIWPNYKWYVTLVLLWLFVSAAFDAYDLAVAADPGLSTWSASRSVALTTVIYLAVPWLTPPLENRSQGFLFVLLSVGTIATWRLLYARLFVQPVFQRRALVVGAGRSAEALAQALRKGERDGQPNPYSATGHVIVGYVDDDPARQGQSVGGAPVLGDSSQLKGLIRQMEVDELVVAITDTSAIRPSLFEAILDCREAGFPVVTMTTLYERLTGRVAFEHASRNVEIATGQGDSAGLRLYTVFKRSVDLAGALTGLLLLVILTPLVALVNALTSPGPLFFRQERVGQGGRTFHVLKFRSMHPGAETDTGPVWARPDDERVTPVGRLLRRAHLDELPQVVNVLGGEMSLVGPRPERPEFVDGLSRTIPFYRARHSVKPGITGWAQIHQDYGDSVAGAREKLEYDLYYIKHAGALLDSLIVLRTISRVLSLRGR
jgi:exopolysaccharide biosynthesis polyprenyl glycosylphosphotransferase